MSSSGEYAIPSTIHRQKQGPSANYEQYILHDLTKTNNGDTHIYQILEPAKKTAVYANTKVAGACADDSRLYDTVTTNSTIVSGASLRTASQKVSPTPPNDYRDNTCSNSITAKPQDSDSAHTKESRTSMCNPIQVALTCIGVLVLVVATAIAVTALVLILKKKADPSTCQCQEYDQQGNLQDQINDFIKMTNNKLDAMTTQIEKNKDDTRALQTRVGGIVNLHNCTNDIESSCHLDTDNNYCTTDGVKYQKQDQLVLDFTCFSTTEGITDDDSQPNQPNITTFVHNNEIKCSCTFPTTKTEYKCGLNVTRCIL